MTNIICSWVIPIILNVGLVLFGFWMGNRAGKKNADCELRHQLKTLQANYDWLKDYSDQQDKKSPKDNESVPVIYYFKSSYTQQMKELAAWNSQYGLSCGLAQVAHLSSPFGLIYAAPAEQSPVYCGRPMHEVLRNFKYIEHIEIKDLDQFCRTIAIGIRDHGIKVDDKAKTIRVYRENESKPKVIDNGVEFECMYRKIDKPKKA